MAKKEDVTVLDGNLSNTYLVQKSEPLLLMRSVPFGLGELKILDTYLSRINSHDDNCCTVTFTKVEYEKLMGISKTNLSTLKKYTSKMLGKVVEIPIENGYVQFVLFTCAACELNKHGERIIKLTCSNEAKQLFFNIEQLGYLQYELRNVLALSSKYSFLLYLYLRKECYRGNWTIPLDELREQRLDINNEYYKSFKRFNDEILKKAIAEISKKTDIKVTYSIQKSGRYVVAIQFHVAKMLEVDLENGQLLENNNIKQLGEDVEKENCGNELSDLLANTCNNEFTKEQIQILTDMIKKIMPKSDNATYCNYLTEQLHRLEYYGSKKPIKNKFEYLKIMIANDSEKKKEKVEIKNNRENQSYDIDEMDSLAVNLR